MVYRAVCNSLRFLTIEELCGNTCIEKLWRWIYKADEVIGGCLVVRGDTTKNTEVGVSIFRLWIYE